MRALRSLLGVLILVPVSLTAYPAHIRVQANASSLPSPRVAPVRPVTDIYYGTKLIDPYRYMENLADPEVQSWIKDQNDYTRAVLASLPGREKLLSRIVELDQSTAADIGRVHPLPGEVYLYTKLLAGADIYKLYLRKGLQGEEKLLVDPERIAIAEANRGKGKNAIGTFAPSNDLKYVAVTITPGGSENDTEIHVLDTTSGRETGDVIPRCCIKSDPMWLPDNRSFVYGRLQDLPAGAPATEVRQKYRTYLYFLGTSPERELLATPSGLMDASVGRFGLRGEGTASVASGQQIEATGVMKRIKGKSLFLVHTMKVEGEVYIIRNEHGFPVSPQARERVTQKKGRDGESL